jgi:DNA invertase Pin-like site-specific DNA recombinase
MPKTTPYRELLAKHAGDITQLSQTMLADGWPTEEVEGGLSIGYARSHSDDEDCWKQIVALRAKQVHRGHLHVDRDELWETQKRRRWPRLALAMKDVRSGDTFVAWDLLTLGVSMIAAARLIMHLRENSVYLRLLHDTVDTRTPEGRMMANVFCAAAVMANEKRRAGTIKGLKQAQQKGNVGGRRRVLDGDTLTNARKLMSASVPMTKVAQQLKISRQTLYNSGLSAFAVRKPKQRKK